MRKQKKISVETNFQMVVLGFVFVVGLEISSVWPVQAKCRRKFFRPPIDFSCFFLLCWRVCENILCSTRGAPELCGGANFCVCVFVYVDFVRVCNGRGFVFGWHGKGLPD